MDITFKTCIAIIYLLYGIFKVMIGVALFTVPKDVLLKKVKIMKYLISEEKDDTISGHLYEYVLLAFGIFTFLNGLALLHLLPQSLATFFETKYTEYVIFIVLGLILTIFYSLVLFTKLPIPKNEKESMYYKFYGLGGGLFFLIMPIYWECMSYFSPIFNNLSIEKKSIIVLTSIIILFFLGSIVYNYIKYNQTKIPKKYSESIDQIENIYDRIKYSLYHKKKEEEQKKDL